MYTYKNAVELSVLVLFKAWLFGHVEKSFSDKIKTIKYRTWRNLQVLDWRNLIVKDLL